MRIRKTGRNVTIIDLEDGREVLVSYATPVAAVIPGEGFVRTDKKWSRTTSKHIGQYFGGRSFTTKPQSFFDSLL